MSLHAGDSLSGCYPFACKHSSHIDRLVIVVVDDGNFLSGTPALGGDKLPFPFQGESVIFLPALLGSTSL